ncbi:non-ribosomal peptide synthetase, partial [Nitrospirillum sp. BR 11163]|uniref:non-ribosomal peptide synthetase n=1 Tax=Nitrospirillum sp. BR 11163 TaxID=3104323 RepID=UPI002AFEA34D
MVAVFTDCAPSLPAVILGIWKAGAVYLPLATDLPAERLAYMASDAGARVLVTVPCGGDPVPPPTLLAILGPVLDAGAVPPASGVDHGGAGPDDLAYVIYTSGTTGRPKGVAITHRGYVNTILSHAGTVGLTPANRTSLVATPGFDASPWELGMALLNGGGLVPIGRALRDDPWALKRHYAQLGVTCAFHAPSYLRVSAETPFQGLRILNTGGEAPRHGDAARHGPPIAFWNAYGPTETTIIVTIGLVEGDADPRRPLSIGRPLANTRVSLRRDDGTPVPPGEVGELWLAGAGVAQGYLNNPELTADRFVMTDRGRAYRSGDLGRWTPDGRLELLGRMDQQVKLHGQRVELGEIEAALLAHPAVRQAAVLVSTDAGHVALRAFLVPRENEAPPARDAWQAWLSPRLPAHMIPASYTPVGAIPTTASGKVDARALLALAPPLDEGVRTPPSTTLERSVAEVWATLLGGGLPDHEPRVAREDNFFALGGNSLLAVTMAHQLAQALGRPVPARDLFIAPTLARFAAHLAGTEMVADVPAPAEVDPTLATLGEREFWLAEAAGLDTGHFTMPLIRRVLGPVPDPACWDAAWQGLVSRHAALRTTFAADEDGTVRRHVAASAEPAAGLEFTAVADRAAALAHIRDRQCAPLSLRQAPLYRVGVVTVEDGEALFWLALHHAVGDGASLEVLLRDLGTLLGGREPAGAAVDAVGLARQEAAYLAGPDAARDAAAWGATLRALPDALFDDWALDHPRRLDAAARSHRLEGVLPAAQANALRRLARQGHGSLHALMLTLLGGEVFRRTGRGDFLIGSTVSLREDATVAEAVGYAVTLVPVAFHLTPSQDIADRFAAVRSELGSALHHARYPFARLCHDLWRERPALRDPARFPLFDIVVTETPELPGGRGADTDGTRLARLSSAEGAGLHYELAPHGAGQDMALSHEALPDGGLVLKWQMNAAIYDADTAHQWLEGLLSLAAWLADQPALAGRVSSALPSEQALLARWQAGPVTFRPDARPVDLIAAQAAARPEHPALILTDGTTVPYAALLGRAGRLARGLVAQGIRPGQVVAVVAPRGAADLPATLLALWQAGAVYLPLAADLPADRRDFMARDAGAALVLDLTGDGLATLERAGQDGIPLPRGRTGDTAYILYTSGSTGLPKGVRVGHAALLNTLLGVGEGYGLTSNDRTLMFASPAFDVSLSDIGLPLVFGATLCLASTETIERPAALLDLIRDRGVTVADLTPTYLRLLDGALPDSVRILVTGGEAPLAGDVARYDGRLRYVNAYGPTENAITSTMGALPVAGLDGVLATGRPLPNTLVEIRDAAGALAAPGAVGEIWLGGLNLAEGYLNRPDLTAAAFIGEGVGRRYRTGDLGRWRGGHDGGLPVLEVLGRRDHQVKLNGIRIELGEIEAALEAHPAVAQAVVALEAASGGEPGRKSLWAFVRPNEGASQDWLATGWRESLAGHLPAYMIPAALLVVDTIPVTTSGKVDRVALRALLALSGAQANAGPVGGPPQGAVEERVAAAWRDVLGCGAVGREDDFFRLGGHSLLAITVSHQLEKAFGHPVPARELFSDPTLRGFARRVAQLGQGDAGAVSAGSDHATQGQREFWVAEAAGLDTRAFTMALALTVTGAVPDDRAWRRAWTALVRRHDALRCHFEEGADSVRRPVLDGDAVPALVDQHFLFETAGDADAALAQARAQAIPLGQPPLWRAGLVRTAEGAVFWLGLHHAVGDGLSLAVLIEDLTALLRGDVLEPPAGGLARSTAREEAYLASPAADADAAYWRDTLDHLVASPAPEGNGPFDEWPLDAPRPLGRTSQATKGSHSLRLCLDAETTAGLRRIARSQGASLHALMLALMAIEVRRRTGRPNFTLGTAASTRETADEARVVGYYLNMLPLACHLAEGDTLAEVLAGVQQSLADGLGHSRYPTARILADFRGQYPDLVQPGRFPLFDIAVTENPGDMDGDAAQAAAWRFVPQRTPTAGALDYRLTANAPAQDMVLAHEARPDGGHALQLFVNASLYDRETAETWVLSLAALARHVARGAAGQPLPLLLPEEEARLAGWEQGPELVPPAPRFDRLFQDLARSQPDAPALITAAGMRTYAEMEAEVSALAAALTARGLRRGQVVGILTDRSPALPAAALAVWRAGGCYVPLTSDLPGDRLAFIAQDAGAQMILALDGHTPPDALAALGLPLLRPEEVRDVSPADENLPREVGADPAYILYTSGSTGTPKGVVISHAGLMNLTAGLGERFALTPHDRVLTLASPTFDLWISDVVMAWGTGAALSPLTRAEMDDIAAMPALIAGRGITVAAMAPSYLRLFERAPLPPLRILMTVGEAPIAADARHYAGRLACYNGYGPTENTAATTVGLVDPDAPRLTAGRPLPNIRVMILDAQGRQVPPGAIGEIWVAGASLAQGYLNRADLTKRAFPIAADGRRYRTGDLGRWTAGGELLVLGRTDGQVKLRGQRVELGEIAAAIEAQSGVRQAVVLVHKDAAGNQALYAFATGANLADGAAWREALAQRLPSYMLPAAVIPVEAIPTTLAGKVDQASLRARIDDHRLRQAGEQRATTPPQGPVEERIAAAWRDVLGCGAVGREDDFFRLGGHSLLAITVSHQLEKAFGHPVPARELFSDPTLRGFARRVAQLGQGDAGAVSAGSDHATQGQREFWVAEAAGLDTRAFTMALALTVTGAVPDDRAWRRAWTALVRRHDALRCHFEEGADSVRRPVLDGDAVPALVDQHFLFETAGDADAALAQARAQAGQAIPLGQPPLWRAGLVRTAENAVFWLGLHHAVGDGLSLAVLIEDLTALLRGDVLEPPAGSLARSTAREEAYLASPAADADAAYWRDTLDHLVASPAPEGNGPFDEWPLDAPRPLGRTSQATKGSHSLRLCLDAETTAGLRRIARSQGASLHALMLALMAIEVRRRTGRPNFTLGTAASTRETADEARVVGYYLNMLPLACHLADADSLADVLAGVQQSLADGLGHSRYPTARILADFRRDHPTLVQPGRYPLYNLLVSETPMAGESGGDTNWALATATITIPERPTYRLNAIGAAHDMALTHEALADGRLVLQWVVDAELYDQETAETWALSLAALARHVARGAAGQPLPLLLPEEEARLAGWEQGPELVPPAPRFDRLFQDLARSQPDAPALITAAGMRTYAEVEAEVSALAAALAARGLRRGQVVGILTDRSPALPAAALAVWRAGGCYVPLTSDLPGDRLAFIAQDAGAQMILTLDGHTPPDALAALGLPLLRPEEVRDVSPADEDLPRDVGADPAYILYTSGSTGTPKGVVISHAGLMNLTAGLGERFALTPHDRVLTLASPTFDLWISDVVMAWGTGAALSPLTRAEMDDIAAMPALIAGRGITVATMAPSYLRLFERATLPPLRILMTVGEAPIAADARHYAGRLACYNGYGPTENTAATTIGRMDPDAPRLTAGRPLPNIRVMILDAQGRQVPPGAIGEIWVAGASLAQGYLNRADLTKRAFPIAADGRRYRTGDLGRWTAGGELLVLGRTDGQVKLRGQRVELGEIAAAIEAQSGVRQAVVLVHKDAAGNQALYAFAIGANLADGAAWREALAQRLPSYMLPAAVIPVEAIPTTLAGKVDQASLRARIDD